jgi:hypothetical protein
MARRVALPPGLASQDPEQAPQQFVSQSTWDDRAVLARYRRLMGEHFASPDGVFVVDGTGLPTRGRHAVGVSHQYCGALGKRANGQVAVTPHSTGPRGHFPAAPRLHPPESGTGDAGRMDAAGVPAAFRAARVKGEVALDLLDRVRAEGLAGSAVVAGAGYGCSGAFRAGLAARGPRYVVGVLVNTVVFPEEPRWVRPAHGRRLVLAADAPRPVAVEELGRRPRLRRVTWREGTKGEVAARFAWVRVWPGADWHRGVAAPLPPGGPLQVEREQAGEEVVVGQVRRPAVGGGHGLVEPPVRRRQPRRPLVVQVRQRAGLQLRHARRVLRHRPRVADRADAAGRVGVVDVPQPCGDTYPDPVSIRGGSGGPGG